MQPDFVNTMNDFGKNAVEAARSLGEINSKLAGEVIETHLAAMNLCVEGGVSQVKLAQETKDVKDFWSKQAALTDEYAGKAMDLARKNVELAQKAGEQYKAWFEKGFAKAGKTAGDVSKAAGEATKKAEHPARKAATA